MRVGPALGSFDPASDPADESASGPLGLSMSHIPSQDADSSLERHHKDVLERMAFIKQAAADRRLKQSQKPPQEFRIDIPQNGGVVQLKGFRANPDVPMPAKRGKVTTFSRASRRRLLASMNQIDRLGLPCLPIFLTLTVPGDFSKDPGRWKRDLEVFVMRFRRKYPDAIGFWKLEPQQRGAPHFHLLVFCVPWVDKEWLSESWYEVVGSGDGRHLIAGTRVETVRSWNGVNHYASKYLGKVPEGVEWPESVGRWWGVFGRAKLKSYINVHSKTLRFAEFKVIKRAMVGYLRRKGVRMRSAETMGLLVFVDASVGQRLVEHQETGAADRSLADGLRRLDSLSR